MKRKISNIGIIMTGLLFIVAGILFIINSKETMLLAFTITGYIILSTIILKILSIIFKKNKMTIKILDIILNIIISLFLIINPKLFIVFSTQIFGIYALLQGIINIINLQIYNQDNLKGKIGITITGIIAFIFAFLLLYSPTKNSIYVCIVTGIYLIFYGVTTILSITDTKIKIPLPVIFTAFLPQLLIKKIDKEHKTIALKELPDIEILIHLAPSGSATFGHVEFSYKNKIYSYACYNYIGRRLCGGIGDGIFGIFDHNAYIKYCVTEKNRFIISYGMKLTDKEKQKLDKTINAFVNTNTKRWYSESALHDNNLCEKKKFTEMANQIYEKANGIFYKFTSGKYKTFFVFRTNCVSGVDELLSSISPKLIPFEGIISPGTYYKYLDNEYHKKNSRIISKTLYTKEIIKEKKYKYKRKKIDKINI